MAGNSYLMSAKVFIAKLYDIVRNHKTLYVLGTWGWPATPNNKSRAINKQSYNATTARKLKIENASRDTFFFDCSGLIKGILWGWNVDPNKAYGGAGYACNGVPDSSSLISLCKDVSADFSNIVPGELLSMPGHVGIYVGEGKVIECTPKWEDAVQVTYLGNTGNTTGHYRMWDKHGKLPWIDYSTVLGEINQVPSVLPNDNTYEDIYVSDFVPYEVLKGDTLTKIAKKFSTTVEKLQELNNIENPNLIRVGQRLIIKGTAVESKIEKNYIYIVRPGDTLSKIAREFQTSVLAIQAKNGIVNPNKIVVGQVLKL